MFFLCSKKPTETRIVFSALHLAVALFAAGPADLSPDHRAIEVPPRTALYCEDSTHSIQPFIYGDFGDLVAAYDRLEHTPAKVVSGGKREGGEDYDVVMFEAAEKDARSPREVVGYVITRHADGYALRSAYDQPAGLPAQKMAGNEMCVFVLDMVLKSDPARAVSFRNRWRAEHRDSTRP